jgi:sugar fermentation stimulation protein A
MKLPTPLLTGTLIKCYRRSLVDVRLSDGTVVTAHRPNSGKMRGCSEPGRPVVLSDSCNPARRHQLTWELIDMNDTWIGVNPSIPGKVVYEALKLKLIPPLALYDEVDQNAAYGVNKRVDLLLQGRDQNCFINLFNVTWVENGVALYPETVSARSTTAVRELTDIAHQGHRAVVFFFVQRSDCSTFKPAEHVDREFLKALLVANSANVEIMVYRALVTPTEIALGVPIPFSLE